MKPKKKKKTETLHHFGLEEKRTHNLHAVSMLRGSDENLPKFQKGMACEGSTERYTLLLKETVCTYCRQISK